MSAEALNISKLGIFAGSGSLPVRLLEACDKHGIEVFIIAFEGQTDPALVEGRAHLWTRLGAAGKIIKTLRAHDIRDIVFIGAIQRPGFTELKPDLKAASVMMKIGTKALGDDGLLRAVRRELESEGFTMHGVQAFVDDLVAAPGAVGRYEPQLSDQADIDRGLEVARTLGALDIGQSAVVQNGIVLGVEGIEGTDNLIKRCGDLKRKGPGPVLIKMCKPDQDRKMDLPTIGPQTVENAIASGFRGIMFQAGATLLLDPQTIAETADRAKIFVSGIKAE